MFRFITKKEFWQIIDNGDLSSISHKMDHRLKTVEDAVVWNLLKDSKGLTIGEIGGGNSRVLPSLARRNKCYNIDKFQGAGNGPTEVDSQEDISNIFVDLGDFSEKLKESTFDVLFSISVVEHIPSKELKDFFLDSYRVLKPGGKLIHVIDSSLKGSSSDNSIEAGRILEIARHMDNHRLQLMEEPEIKEPKLIYFKTSFATNPDHIMKGWMDNNRSRQPIYESYQTCCYLLASTKL